MGYILKEFCLIFIYIIAKKIEQKNLRLSIRCFTLLVKYHKLFQKIVFMQFYLFTVLYKFLKDSKFYKNNLMLLFTL